MMMLNGAKPPVLPRGLLRLVRWLPPILLCLAVPSPCVGGAPVTEGVWLMDAKVAVQIFDCGEMMCGRIIWLIIPRDAQGVLNRDLRNPDAALRQRPLCGMTILWALHPVGSDKWEGGWFYNPFDGETYRVSARLKSADVMTARIYRGLPLFGKTKTLQRVVHGTVEGWC
ncbi:DUF2147 domain-containing protein [Sphingomonas oligophenolica]|uniref:DUF2147 domain-containing protein n=1 Tax=Sphingomonas oligophenolica TaxID=301154 RepID=A0ABU9Y2D1_9SPHN